MFVTYTPEDGETQRWEFSPGRVRQSDAALIEKQYGQTWERFCGDVQAGSIKARRVLLWHLMRRDHHTLRFEDVPDFYADEVVIEHNASELASFRERLLKAGLPEMELAAAVAMLDDEIAQQGGAEQVEGKAISNSVA